jgi:glucose/mannose-6-phosphate isomerase
MHHLQWRVFQRGVKMTPSILDNIPKMLSLDRSGMMGLVLGLPGQCRGARRRVKAHPPQVKRRGFKSVLVSGLGGSAIGADVVRALITKQAGFSLTVNRNYGLPAWASRDTLVVCSSYSGNTEETLSAFQLAVKKKLPILAISSGGKLLAQARRRNLPCLELTSGLPPRAAFGYSFATLLTALETLKLLPSFERDFNGALELLECLSREWGPARPALKNEPKQLALFLRGCLPVIYAGQDHFDAVGLRWKGQLNENAKQVALFNVLPEMNHNEIMGFSRPDRLTKQMAAVLLRHPSGDHPQTVRRFCILKSVLKTRTAGVREVTPRGKCLLAQMLSCLYLGDFMSVYLAFLKGLDPTPMRLIDEFKKKLASP